ncbi:MAG: hypothetical protein EBX04_02095 [Rhodobacteraceae bacterium]|nr:hypothetical protein [Paracoccaceae bacterium]
MSFKDKLTKIKSNLYTKADFIIADAKDGDMAFGCATAGVNEQGVALPIKKYRDDIVRVVSSELVDIMLTSVSNAEILSDRNLYENQKTTLAVRLNDTTDIWHVRGATYPQHMMRNFRSAEITRAKAVAELGLYSVTFYNDLERDLQTLQNYKKFRNEASELGFDHFLEVFNPQIAVKTEDDFWKYNNDMIVRCLAGVSQYERPLFLKAAYNGPAATEEISKYDPAHLVFGILGGGAGTTRDCLELLKQAEKYGARVALFGRKIYQSECSISMITAMRRVLEQDISSIEGVKAYHYDLSQLGITPKRALVDDLELTEEILQVNV